MVTLRRLLLAAQFVLGCSALLLWFCHGHYYRAYVTKGSSVASSMYPVEIHEHGSTVYISTHQSHVLIMLASGAVSSFVFGALIDLYRRKRYPGPKEQ
jgi:hypothetical protein